MQILSRCLISNVWPRLHCSTLTLQSCLQSSVDQGSWRATHSLSFSLRQSISCTRSVECPAKVPLVFTCHSFFMLYFFSFYILLSIMPPSVIDIIQAGCRSFRHSVDWPSSMLFRYFVFPLLLCFGSFLHDNGGIIATHRLRPRD